MASVDSGVSATGIANAASSGSSSAGEDGSAGSAAIGHLDAADEAAVTLAEEPLVEESATAPAASEGLVGPPVAESEDDSSSASSASSASSTSSSLDPQELPQPQQGASGHDEPADDAHAGYAALPSVAGGASDDDDDDDDDDDEGFGDYCSAPADAPVNADAAADAALAHLEADYLSTVGQPSIPKSAEREIMDELEQAKALALADEREKKEQERKSAAQGSADGTGQQNNNKTTEKKKKKKKKKEPVQSTRQAPLSPAQVAHIKSVASGFNIKPPPWMRADSAAQT